MISKNNDNNHKKTIGSSSIKWWATILLNLSFLSTQTIHPNVIIIHHEPALCGHSSQVSVTQRGQRLVEFTSDHRT